MPLLRCQCCGRSVGEFHLAHCVFDTGLGPDRPGNNPVLESECESPKAIDKQEGGDHYKKLPIQPVQYIHANGIGYFEGNVIKYVTRWRDKNGIDDLRKAIHYIELLIELELAQKL